MTEYHVSVALLAAKASSTEHHHRLDPILHSFSFSLLVPYVAVIFSRSLVFISLPILSLIHIIRCLWIGFKAFWSKVGRLVSSLRTIFLIVCVNAFAFDIRVTYDGHVSYTIEKIILAILNINFQYRVLLETEKKRFGYKFCK